MDDFDEEICGKCVYHKKSDGEWICGNEDSECYGCSTEFKDACSDYCSKYERDVFRNRELRKEKSRWGR